MKVGQTAASATKARAPVGSPWRSREEGSLLLGSVLWIVARLRRPLTAFGVDYPIFRELLRVRLLMDLRPASTGGSGFGAAGIALSILMTWMIGLGTGLAALVEKEANLWPVVALAALFGLLLFYLLQTLVGMLIDPVDVRVLTPHPVPDRTLFAVRLTQVFAYLLLLSAGFTAGNVILAVFAEKLLPTLVVFPLLALLCTLSALGSVALFFAALLRMVGPASFQRVSLWTQVGSAAVFMFVTQTSGRLLPRGVVKGLWESRSSWKLLLPPVQGARAFELASGDGSAQNWAGLACVLATPALALWVTLRLASRSYIAALEGTLELGRRSGLRWPRESFGWIVRRLARSREQHAGLAFTLALARREPHVLRAVLPQLVSFLVMATTMSTSVFELPGGVGFFVSFSAGLVALVLPGLLEATQGSPVPEARWVFLTAPITDEAELMRGGVKGLVLSWYGAVLAVVGVVQLLFVGAGELPSIVLALELSAIVALSYTRIFALGVPFTRDIKKSGGYSNLGLILTMFFALGILGGVHWVLVLTPFTLAAGVVVGAVVIRLQWRALDAKPVAAERRLLPREKGA